MGFEVTINLGDVASERVSAVTGELASFRDVEEYVNDLIRRDAEDALHRDPATVAALRAAFAVPEQEAEDWNVEEFLSETKRQEV